MSVSEKHELTLREQARWIAAHWRPYRIELPVLVFLTLANAVALVLYPWLLKRIVDGVEDSLSVNYLVENVVILLGVGVLHFAIYVTLQSLRARLNLRFEFGVRQRAFEYVARMGPGFFSRFRTGDLVTRLTDDINEKLNWFMCAGIFRVLEAGALIVAGVIMMLLINPALTLWTAGPLPILIGMFVFTAGHLHRRYELVQLTISRLNDALESCFSGIRVVKAFTAEPGQQTLVDDAIEQNRIAEVRAIRWQTVIDTLYGNIWQLAIIGVLFAGGAMVIDGRATIGDLFAFDAYVLMLIWPMFDIGQFLVRGRLASVSMNRVNELETAPPEPADSTEPAPTPRRPDSPPPVDFAYQVNRGRTLDVAFRDVGYRYEGADREAITGISFTAKAGELTAVVGAIGCGKSTLLALPPRMTDPTAGQVLVAGRATTDWDPTTLRQSIGYVPQEVNLLSGTIRENIRFGRQWIDDDDLELAVDVARLRGEIAGWPDGLDTVVGSRGLRLSGGQKQRVALARALAGRPGILLLDDCTASLDAETEEQVWRELAGAIPGCAIILVTHRPATLQRSNQIIVLDRGRIREQGNFKQLSPAGTYFHELYVQWKLQDELE